MSEQLARVQLVERRRPRVRRFYRAIPYTAIFPHDGQIQTRLAFAGAAEKAKGRKGLCPCHQLPWAAHYVAVERANKTVPTPTPPQPPLWWQRLQEFKSRLLAAAQLPPIKESIYKRESHSEV